ncbi:MAG TPA: SCO family protein [Bryobacteraceae bacterium]|jgi:protein SCO1/2|nr:SCO family protein [Bryobacteraceae bacterium]
MRNREGQGLTGCVLRTAGLVLVCAALLPAQYSRPKITDGVKIEQKLNGQLPLDLVFHNENDQPVRLGKFFGEKPVVLSLVYFNCQSLCPMSLHETVDSLKRVSLQPGRDYNVVVVSFDPNDTARSARLTKEKYKGQFVGRTGYDAGFHFLTGNQEAIAKLTSAAGFGFRYDTTSRQFVHAGGIMVATPEGKLSRYFYGIDYAPADVRMALVDASEHKIGSPMDYVLLFCFHYDATQGKYTLAILNILKVAGSLTVLALFALIYYLMRDDNQNRTHVTWKEAHRVG